MLYAVGTKIDLRYLNETKVEAPQREPARPALYPVGTKIVFLRDLSERTVLKITNNRLAMSAAAGA